MKKKITLILLSVFFIGGVFASGQNEDGSYRSPAGPGMGNFQYQDQEMLELTGILELINGNPPNLIVGSQKYSLMVPQYLLFDLEIQNGEKVTVKGYEMPSHMWQWDDLNMSLYVTNATIKGENYDLSNYYGGHMMGGRGFGGGRGRGRGCW